MHFHELNSGFSVEGTEIKSYRTDVDGDKYIYLMAGVHGDEVEGVYVVEQLFNWLKTQDQMHIPLVVVPIVNVDGYRANTRVNANGVDLNRNLSTDCWTSEVSEKKYYPGNKPLSEPENQYLINLFKKYPPGLILSIHSWKPLVNFNGDCLDVANYLGERNGYEVVADIGYPTPGSLGTYGPAKLDCPVLTFECPIFNDEKGLKEIWLENEDAFKGIFLDKIYSRFL
ncbi:M14 family zinc carboxypeptidase [Bacteriovorax sp. Seq25_V]|uniref:M14 family zinc carboxypeptidase n=1 Tax=Bacteriovorax sp. Seq25_V TaxID=1201288 RepID=UPI00038A1098|nr:M14 family zinc carboxypeptidase [Bacteriovorax sp. Seq25_V]EQC44316.1 succinylglutamate desuccinylase/aspartoacylase domain protein [Bacteriovorax sp. Seq25_V]